MTRISSTDIICATASIAGRQLVSLRFSGVSSMTDLIDCIIGTLRDCMGMVTLHIRNLTEGWSARHSVRINAS